MKKYNSIGRDEARAAYNAVLNGPLSGYLGGIDRGGPQVEALEEEWCEKFGSHYAVACNSATSGLLLACRACGIGSNSDVLSSSYTMSATAAVPTFLGADAHFGDIDGSTYCLDPPYPYKSDMIITNLFGHPARLHEARTALQEDGPFFLIEDNAQAIGAMENGRYTGTIGHIGVFSLNVHKHIQAGEGGICTTDDPVLAERMRKCRNHGELAGYPAGLNLRMTEVTAAIARVQLKKLDKILSERIEIAETLTDMVVGLPGICPPEVRKGCKHVYYIWAIRCSDEILWELQVSGVPITRGYVKPLHTMGQRKHRLPVTEEVESTIAIYENCAWTPSGKDLQKWREAFKRATDENLRTGNRTGPAALSGGRDKLQSLR